METIGKAFKRICSDYFPSWKDAKNWRVSQKRRGKETREDGYCDKATKTVFAFGWTANANGDKLIIHELCHAVASVHHGKRWQDRMEQAAARAEALGVPQVAAHLREEIENYNCGISYAMEMQSTRDLVGSLAQMPGMTFERALEGAAGQIAMTPEQLLKAVPNARNLFDEARQEQEARARKLEEIRRSREQEHKP